MPVVKEAICHVCQKETTRRMGPGVRRDDRLRYCSASGLIVASLLGAAPAQAHPHVWITAKSEVVYAPDGSISGVRHAWTFDDMFSTYALQGIETKTKGVYSREELAPLAQTNVESLKEFGFFTFAKADGKKQRFLEPVDYYLEYKDDALTLHFMLPAKTPFKAKQPRWKCSIRPSSSTSNLTRRIRSSWSARPPTARCSSSGPMTAPPTRSGSAKTIL